jgi:protoporphyrinogen/coproporphyrinogen III oxidase
VSTPARVVVVGGGISGLATAYRLLASTAPGSLSLTVLEASDRLGGRIQTEQFAGRPVDAGADAILARVPQAPALLRELGLGERLISPATDRAYIWTRGALRPLPSRLLAGLPDGAGEVASCGILSRAGLLRAGLDLVLPSRAADQDVSVGSLVRRRLGDQVFERLVDPLLGGIHAGRCDELSLRATAPQLEAAVRSGHGLVRGLRGLAPAAGGSVGSAPTFVSVRDGVAGLIDALAGALGRAEVRTDAAVEAVAPGDDAPLRVLVREGGELSADHVVLTLPAYAAAEVLAASCGRAADALREIEYASVATVLLSYAPSALTAPLEGSGFLVPQAEQRTITACTWSSSKWPGPDGDGVVLKASVGRFGSEEALGLDDDQLADRVHSDLVASMRLRESPKAISVRRFDRALAQYRVGHLELVARIEHELEALPGVSLAGAAYRGVGIASCIRDAERVAAAVVGRLTTGAEHDAPVAN